MATLRMYENFWESFLSKVRGKQFWDGWIHLDGFTMQGVQYAWNWDDEENWRKHFRLLCLGLYATSYQCG